MDYSETPQWRLSKYLDQSNRLVNNYYARYIKEYGLTMAQARIIGVLVENDGISQEMIAKELNVAKSAVRICVQQLLGNNFIYQVPDANDKRIRHLHLTDKALELIPVILKLARQTHDKLMESLTEYERIVFLGLLEKVANRAQELSAGDFETLNDK